MDPAVWWALSTGLVTGGVWVGIVLVQRQHRLAGRPPRLLEDVAQRLGGLEERLAEVEERLDFAERMLAAEGGPVPPQFPAAEDAP